MTTNSGNLTLLYSNVSSFMTNKIETFNNTPFVKDVTSKGILSGINGGTEREKLKYFIRELKSDYDKGANIDYILKKYDEYTETFSREDIVNEMRNRLLKNTVGKNKKENNKMHLKITHEINGKHRVEMLDNTEKLENDDTIEIVEITSEFDELSKIYELMSIYGVANVRGACYQSEKMRLEDANNLIKTINYLNRYVIKMDNQKWLDATIVETYLLWRNGFLVEEIAEMKSLTVNTINYHLEKNIRNNVRLERM